MCFVRLIAYADPESFFRGGPSFILADEWIQIPLESDHHWLASETPFKWCFAGRPMIAQH